MRGKALTANTGIAAYFCNSRDFFGSAAPRENQFGTALGYPFAVGAQWDLNRVVNHWSQPVWRDWGLTIQQRVPPSPVPGVFGTAVGSALQETGNAWVNRTQSPIPSDRPTRGGR